MQHSRAKSPLFTLYLYVWRLIRHFEGVLYKILKKAFFTAFLSFFVHYSDFGIQLRVIIRINPCSLQASYEDVITCGYQVM